LIRERKTQYLLGFIAALAIAAGIAAYNLHGAFTLGTIPPGRMSPLSFTGLKDLQRGQLTGVALKPQSLLAFVYQRAGLSDFPSLELATMTFFAAIPVAGGLFSRLATKSLLVGAVSAILLSLLPFGYISAVQGDYSFISAISLTFAALSPTLLFLRGGRAPWLALSAVLAVLVGMSATSGAMMLFITCATWALFSLLSGKGKECPFVILPGLVALAARLAVPQSGTEEVLRQFSLASALPGYAGVLGVVGIGGLIGGVALALRERRFSIPMLMFVGSGLALIPFFWWEALLLFSFVVALLVAQPLTEATKVATITRSGALSGTGSTVVELDLPRVVAIAVSLLALSSPIVAGLGPGQALQGTNYLGAEELAALQEVQSLSPSLFGQGLVAAPSSIAPWLRAELGVNALLPLNANQSAEEDAITATSFRVRSSYMMADDWTPLNFARSPLIYAFDGLTYAPVLHLDDAQNRVNLTYGNVAANEDLARMNLSGHGFRQNSQNISLTFQLAKLGFNATKELTLSKNSSVLSISYVVTPNQGNNLLSMTLPVYIEGIQHIQSVLQGNTLHLRTTSSNLSLSFAGGSPPRLVTGGPQGYVESIFNSTAGTILASVTVTVESARSSGMGMLYASLLDDIGNKGISSLLTFTPSPGLNFLASSVAQPAPSLDVKDAFSRVLLTSGGANYTEAPSSATVLSQNISDSCDATFRYQTAGLVIVKSLSQSGNALSLSYQVTPSKADTVLREMNVTLWIPYDRSMIGYRSNSSAVNLALDSGPVGIKATSGHTLGTEVGPDPAYGQARVLFHFSLNPSGDEVGILITFAGGLSCQQLLTSRPVMIGSDELVLSTTHGFFDQVFSNNVLTVYRIAHDTNEAS
jgi:hypothetical protein